MSFESMLHVLHGNKVIFIVIVIVIVIRNYNENCLIENFYICQK